MTTRTKPPSSPPAPPPASLPVDLEVSIASFLGKTTSKPRYVHPFFWEDEHLRALLIDAESLSSNISVFPSPRLYDRSRRSPSRSPLRSPSRTILSTLARSIRQHYAFDAFDHGRLSGIKKCLDLMSSASVAVQAASSSSSSSCFFNMKLNTDIASMFKTAKKDLNAEFPQSASNALTRVVSDMFLRGVNEDHFEFGGNNVLPKGLRVTRAFTSAAGPARVPFCYGDVVKDLPVDAVASVRPRRDADSGKDVVERRIAAAKDEEASSDDGEGDGVVFRFAAVVDPYRHDARYKNYATSKRGWSILRRMKVKEEDLFGDNKGGNIVSESGELKPYYFAVLIALAQQQWMENPTFESYTAHVFVPCVPLSVTVISATFSNAYLSILLAGGERDECRGDALPAPSTVHVKVRRFSLDPVDAGRRGGFFDCLADITAEAVNRAVLCTEEQDKEWNEEVARPPPVIAKKEEEKEKIPPAKEKKEADTKKTGLPPLHWYFPGEDKENEPSYKLSSPKKEPDTKPVAPRPRSRGKTSENVQSANGVLKSPKKQKQVLQSPKKLRSKQGLALKQENIQKPKPMLPSKLPVPRVVKRKALDDLPHDTNGFNASPTKKLCQVMSA